MTSSCKTAHLLLSWVLLISSLSIVAYAAAAVDNDVVTVNEGETATNAGVFADFGTGEVTVTASVGTVAAQSGPSGSPGVYVDSGQNLGSTSALSFGTSLGDVDGDGDLDAFVAVYGQSNQVWLNQGGVQGGTPGVFADSVQNLGTADSLSVDLGDVDGDGDLDAFVATRSNQPNTLWVNQGGTQGGTPGIYLSGQALGASDSLQAQLGDVDGDGDLDAFVAIFGANEVWLNQGGNQGGTPGTFLDSGQALGSADSLGLDLGDVDGDGDRDAFVINNAAPGKVWLNQGGVQAGTPGVYLDSGQSINVTNGYGVDLGDVDGDGDLDAFITAWGTAADRVWLNQGGAQAGTPGVYLDSGQTLGGSWGHFVRLGDVDRDGDLDAFVTNDGANRVWLNQGGVQGGVLGVYLDSGQALGTANSYGIGLGDVDGDGDLDAFVVNRQAANKVWVNQGGPVVHAWIWSYDSTDGPGQSQTVTITATDSEDATSMTTFGLVVNNVAPTANLDNDGPVIEDTEATVTFSSQVDPSTVDTGAGFRYAYDFDNDGSFEIGDGTYAGSVADASATVPAAYLADPGLVTVAARILDKDGGYADVTTVIEVQVDPTGVELGSFRAVPQDSPQDPAIQITWETTTEVDLLGFNLYRAESAEGAPVRLNDLLLPARNPGSPTGARYVYMDASGVAGVPYAYWLEVIGTSGRPERHGPVVARFPEEPKWRIYLPSVFSVP